MAVDVDPSGGETIRLAGRRDLPGWVAGASVRTRLVVVLLSIVMFIGCVTWGMLSGLSSTGSERGATPSPVLAAQNAPEPDPVETPTEASC